MVRTNHSTHSILQRLDWASFESLGVQYFSVNQGRTLFIMAMLQRYGFNYQLESWSAMYKWWRASSRFWYQLPSTYTKFKFIAHMKCVTYRAGLCDVQSWVHGISKFSKYIYFEIWSNPQIIRNLRTGWFVKVRSTVKKGILKMNVDGPGIPEALSDFSPTPRTNVPCGSSGAEPNNKCCSSRQWEDKFSW